MPFDLSVLNELSLVGYLLVFLGGVITSLGPCNVATIPLIVGYVGGSHDLSRWRSFTLSLAFAIGLAITFMALGVVAALIGGLIGAATRWWYYLVAAVCFVIGLQMLGVLTLNMPMWFGGMRERIAFKGAPGALVLGLVSGLVASQCATPVLAAILTYGLAEGAIVYGATLLFLHAATHRLAHYSLTEEGSEAIGTLCGGEVKVFLQPYLAPPKLIIVGGGHIGRPLKVMGEAAGFEVEVVDVEAGRANIPELAAVDLNENSFVVLITTDHISDKAALRYAIQTPVQYIGMISSRKKCQTILDHLRANGYVRRCSPRFMRRLVSTWEGPRLRKLRLPSWRKLLACDGKGVGRCGRESLLMGNSISLCPGAAFGHIRTASHWIQPPRLLAQHRMLPE